MRSKWKGPFIDQSFIKKHELMIKKKRKNTWRSTKDAFVIRSRRSTILPLINKMPVKIYSGNRYVLMDIQEYHLGNKFGNFILTKSFCINNKTKKGKKK
jgi:ribosomal protein S19